MYIMYVRVQYKCNKKENALLHLKFPLCNDIVKRPYGCLRFSEKRHESLSASTWIRIIKCRRRRTRCDFITLKVLINEDVTLTIFFLKSLRLLGFFSTRRLYRHAFCLIHLALYRPMSQSIADRIGNCNSNKTSNDTFLLQCLSRA